MKHLLARLAGLLRAAVIQSPQAAEPMKVLFVGRSFASGRAPVVQYN